MLRGKAGVITSYSIHYTKLYDVTIAEPVGIICGIVPTTNPTSTAIFKSVITSYSIHYTKLYDDRPPRERERRDPRRRQRQVRGHGALEQPQRDGAAD